MLIQNQIIMKFLVAQLNLRKAKVMTWIKTFLILCVKILMTCILITNMKLLTAITNATNDSSIKATDSWAKATDAGVDATIDSVKVADDLKMRQ